ncbi:MAG: TIGR04149 family rSAM-modified RiPP [Bacteroides pyogenes]|uniref:TIGR04149 family rSAM-modified RiPP n=1 Tax=Bacteroides TaxID=816 RepID=UPI00242EA057|nr:TIGR04149 family rSAM-modified RiPP [Bacteroides pyogenes]MCI7071780.1 TIGR04149 family rSAM-modified RiPP [Bacteroides pyogenes]MDY5353094.1 TIGR04149 family rSAM-modified RiPP [Bacteroides pyogenes]
MKLQKIKLNKLAENSLANREMKELKGGKGCQCSCCYAGSGGSSTTDNGNANAKHGYHSTCDPTIELPEVVVKP